MTVHPWVVTPTDVRSAEALALLRDYFTEVADRYSRLHHDRGITRDEVDSVLAEWPSDHLAGPTGVFLVGRHRGRPRSCAGLLVREPGTVELTRVYVHPDLRGTGGGAALLAAVEASARTLGAHRIVLDTRLDLVEARALYVRHGYREIPAFSNGPYSEAWYGKELAARAG
ncbi:GNAT family N-acetyltransferase [Pseudonocardia sp. TRM90224]|uniref:GNAT family N-acetyltransferase n=1 Tax=Pseudonocardia sp. TRM90224 TaxID=2812678 RepID=UPI001E52A86C|nr:GNAT family N-acetyltransferase [Pseudonocardia sp. TRM90224]